MAISYILSQEELAMLAELSQADSFKHLDPLPILDAAKKKELLELLEGQGFIKIDSGVQIDAAIHFIIKSMANAELILPVSEKTIVYCTKNICSIVTPDKKTGHKLKITPIETVKETVEALAQLSDANKEEMLEKIKKVYIKGASDD